MVGSGFMPERDWMLFGFVYYAAGIKPAATGIIGTGIRLLFSLI